MKLLKTTLVSAIVLTGAVNAAGDNTATGTIGISGTVPVYCTADMSEITGQIELGNELGWQEYTENYNFSVECNNQADIAVTITGTNGCSAEHVFGGAGNLQRDFCLQNGTDATAKLPYSVKAWGKNHAGAACGSDFHNIISGALFHLSKNCITKTGTGAWSNYKTNVLMRINVDTPDDALHLPAGVYSDTLAVLVSWS